MGRTTLSEVKDYLVPGEDDLSDNITDNSELEGEREGKAVILTGPVDFSCITFSIKYCVLTSPLLILHVHAVL